MTNKSTTALALVLAASATPALAQASWTFSDIDADGNLELSQAELEAMGREVFVVWDADADQEIAEEEFYTGLYQTWDRDRDAILTEEEYTQGWGTWFGDMEQTPYADLDVDADAELAEDEFVSGFTDAGLYDTYTGGTALGEEEFVTTIYGTYDIDDDDVITQVEYEDVGLYGTETARVTEVETEIGVGEAGAGTIEAEIISLADWDYDDLYTAGVSAEEFLGTEVYGIGGEELGELEDIIIGPEGQILSAIAEVGGFIDIGDTHVSIPWDEVEVTADGIVIPVTEETVGEYGVFETDWISAEEAATEIVSEVDDAETGPRAWRLQELIGDYVRLAGDETVQNYGYVNDVILRDGEVAAVIVEGSAAYGGGYRAYPYYGYGYGWTPGTPYYDMPYGEAEVGEMEPFDYERLGAM